MYHLRAETRCLSTTVRRTTTHAPENHGKEGEGLRRLDRRTGGGYYAWRVGIGVRAWVWWGWIYRYTDIHSAFLSGAASRRQLSPAFTSTSSLPMCPPVNIFTMAPPNDSMPGSICSVKKIFLRNMSQSMCTIANGTRRRWASTVYPTMVASRSASFRDSLGPRTLPWLRLPLYCEDAPHTTTRAPRRMIRSTSSRISPPTVSKRKSTPSGHSRPSCSSSSL
mmetsp:Transcript_15488/g.50580  ORF Transcript_15488/g.50580 Transcript_15488/m.50580 type:complete len:222 (-) Transcript_15488:679-1344(-)